MSNKLVTFRHKKHTTKVIPGVKSIDLQPRMKQVIKRDSNAMQANRIRVADRTLEAGMFPVLELDESYTPSIVLVDESYQDLSPAEKQLPRAMKKTLEEKRAADAFNRIDANKKVMDVLYKLQSDGEIEILGIKEMTPEEVIKTNFPIVSLSAIARADYEARGIDIPAELQSDPDTERVRAQQSLAASP